LHQSKIDVRVKSLLFLDLFSNSNLLTLVAKQDRSFYVITTAASMMHEKKYWQLTH